MLRSNRNHTPTSLDDEMAIPPVVAASNMVDPESLDELFAKELNSLSLKERELVSQEIHGVADRVVEEPFWVSHCLTKLEAILRSLPASDMGAYWQAYALNPAYPTNREFRLKFLRAERFNIVCAAERMARYFRHKSILFGSDKLCKTITLDDLSKDDRDALECGYIQWLPERDSVGRKVLFTAIPLRRWKERSNLLRALWYLLNAALEEEETQIHGIVSLVYMMGFNTDQGPLQNRRPPLDRRAGYYVSLTFEAIAGRVEVIHCCCEHASTALAVKVILFASGTEFRIRTRTHFGSHIEVIYALLSFGLPVSTIPVSERSEFYLEPHMAWIESRRQKELLLLSSSSSSSQPEGRGVAVQESSLLELQKPPLDDKAGLMATGYAAANAAAKKQSQSNQKKPPSSSTSPSPPPSNSSDVSMEMEEVEPRPQDILLGHLKVAKNQLGNDLLAELIEEYRFDYEERCTTKLEKMKLTKQIVEQLKSRGCRFLKQTKLKYNKYGRIENKDASIGWMEVPDVLAKQKVSHSFRNLRLRAPPPSTRIGTKTDKQTTATAENKMANGDGDNIGAVSQLSCSIPPSMVGPSAGHGCMAFFGQQQKQQQRQDKM